MRSHPRCTCGFRNWPHNLSRSTYHAWTCRSASFVCNRSGGKNGCHHMSHPDHERSFKSHMSHWSLNELLAKYIEIHILEFWPAVSCFEIRKHLCHRFGSNANTPLGWCVQTASHATDLAGLWCSSHWNHWFWAHQAQGKTKTPVCVCLCHSVSKILFISFETFFYAANVNHIQGCWRLPPARIIQSSGFCSQSLSSHSPLPFPVIIPKCSAKLNEDSPYADVSWRCTKMWATNALALPNS